MDNEYSTRSNFLESLAIDNSMKMRLDKMVVIQMETRQRERNQRKVKLGRNIKQTLVLRRKKIF